MRFSLALLLAVVAVLGNSWAAVTPQSDPLPPTDKEGFPTPLFNDEEAELETIIDSDDGIDDQEAEVDVAELDEEDLEGYADAKDLELEGELDVLVAVKQIKARRETTRPKRWIPLAARALWTAGRALFRSSARGALSRSGSRLTRQYASRGNYNDAVRHFRNLRPENVRNFRTSRMEGMTGRVGRHQLTARSSSSSGRPTLEIRSPSGRQGTDTFVRKFRFQD